MDCTPVVHNVGLDLLGRFEVRSIFEYGSVSFLHCPDATIEIMQKIQNRAIRMCLRLPRYVSLSLLHKAACLPTIKERLIQLGARMVAKMRQCNPLIRDIVAKHEGDILGRITKGKKIIRSHRSPLDVILPAQRPFLSPT